MTDLCTNLYQNFDHQGWNEFDLATLPRNELIFLCRMFGAPFYGTKEVIIVRLLSLRIVRKELGKYGGDHSAAVAVAAEFKRSRLRWMCEQARLWKSGNKIALAVCLLTWRNRCRLEGRKFLEACIAASKQAGIQLTFNL